MDPDDDRQRAVDLIRDVEVELLPLVPPLTYSRFRCTCVPSGTFAVLNNCPGEAEVIPSDSDSPSSQTPRFMSISMVGDPEA